jgi:prevent-host-death family protein
MSKTFNLYDAKNHLSALVDRAAAGEEIVIAKHGRPLARLVPIRRAKRRRKPAGALGITYIAPDFDAPLSADVLKEFGIEE